MTQKSNCTDPPKTNFILTPELKLEVQKFVDLFKVLTDKKVSQKNLMICGETGTGKSLFLDVFIELYKFEKGLNSKDDIIHINIASLNKDLIESELFGYVEGAFTGAKKDTPGFIDKANNKLLVLEEIGEIPKNIQAKLVLTENITAIRTSPKQSTDE